MAKKPVEKVEVEEEITSNLDLVKLNKEYPGVLIDGDFLLENSSEVISTGLLSLDIAFSKGVKVGSVVHLGGLTGAGKTSLALTMAAAFIKQTSKNVYHVDVEGRLQPELLKCIEGLDISKFKIIRSSAEKFLNAEEYLTIIETLIKDDPGCMIIIDSIAALCCEAEQVGGMADMQRATMPKLLYKFLRKIAQIIPANKNILISLTHLQNNVSGYGPAMRDVGGNGIHFFASYMMMCMSVTKVEKDGKKVGQDSQFKITKVAGGAPDAEPLIPIRFGSGCCRYTDISNVSIELGLVAKTGAWFTVSHDDFKQEDGKYPKFQGQDNLVEWLKIGENANKMDKIVRNMVFPDNK